MDTTTCGGNSIMGKMSRQKSSDNSLSREQVAWLIFGEDLLSGIGNPFGSAVDAENAWLEHEAELVKIFARRYPGRRPEIFWTHHPRQAVGSAAWLRPDGRVKMTPLLESDSQFLVRTKSYLPHEKIEVEQKAIADGLEQQLRIEATKAWGRQAKISRVLRAENSLGLSPAGS